MEEVKDGGAAFPHVKSRGHLQDCVPGMSLRDWFAGQALAGMTANPNRFEKADEYADVAYQFADAMLSARKED